MKLNLALLMTSIVFSYTALAQQAITMQTQRRDNFSGNGIRLTVFKPTLEAKSKMKFVAYDTTVQNTQKMDQTFGVALGYVALPVQEIGWTMNLGMMRIQGENSPVEIGRADLNLGIAINAHLNIKAGVNAAKITKSDSSISEKLEPRLGFQASLGLQLNQNIGIDIGYTQMNMAGKVDIPTGGGATIDETELELSLSGMEAALTATF